MGGGVWREWGGLMLWVLGEGYEVSFWKAIRKKREVFKSKGHFIVGNGRKVKFWLDKWCGDAVPKASFYAFFATIKSKKSWGSDMREQKAGGGVGHWRN